MIGQLKDLITNGGKPKVSRAQVMSARPIRNPVIVWERETRDEERAPLALLRVPRRRDRWGNFVAVLFRLPESRKLELDEIGSDVWEMCDGAITVDALTKAVCAKYNMNRRQGEASVTAYLRMLAERRLVALRTTNSSSSGAKKKQAQSGSAAASNSGAILRRRKQA